MCYDWEIDPAHFLTFADMEKIDQRMKEIDDLQLNSDDGSNLSEKIRPENKKPVKGVAFEESLSEDEKAKKSQKNNLTLSFSNNDSFSDIWEDSESSFADAGAGIRNHEPKENSFMEDPLLPELVDGMEKKPVALPSQLSANTHKQGIHLDVISLSYDEIKKRPMLEQDANQIEEMSVPYGSMKLLGKH